MGDSIDADVERRLKNIVASMRMEGFDMPQKLIDETRGILTGELDVDEEIARILAPYKSKTSREKD